MKEAFFIIDAAKCHGCNNCFMACKDEFVGNDFPGYSAAQPRHGQIWVQPVKRERGAYPMLDVTYLPMSCQHCEDAPCMKAGGDAVRRHNCGAVIIDPKKAKGNKAIARSCPFGAIAWNEHLDTPQKCTMCAHLLDQGWAKPRCAMACPTGAMSFVHEEREEMELRARAEGLRPIYYKPGVKTHVYYKNLYRFTSNFIGADVVLDDDCLEAAVVWCEKIDGSYRKKTVTNTFGEFKFDGLGAGCYAVTVSYRGCEAETRIVELEHESVYIGEIELTRVCREDIGLEQPQVGTFNSAPIVRR